MEAKELMELWGPMEWNGMTKMEMIDTMETMELVGSLESKELMKLMESMKFM